MKSHSAPHTATFKHKRVRVVLTDGTVFIDRFLDRTKKHVLFARLWPFQTDGQRDAEDRKQKQFMASMG